MSLESFPQDQEPSLEPMTPEQRFKIKSMARRGDFDRIPSEATDAPRQDESGGLSELGAWATDQKAQRISKTVAAGIEGDQGLPEIPRSSNIPPPLEFTPPANANSEGVDASNGTSGTVDGPLQWVGGPDSGAGGYIGVDSAGNEVAIMFPDEFEN